ncbi:hypothetical protein K469DRAFT_186225 [Zopfia rhizophila CBS 207.26]|uniref:Uncharacterized protein n=1 Tax=Zopfia rhizophila CBS 207.26 TaxID=1314779 RepID=A0A6A6E1B0_9PEZI|nr:hypothetical protein K469DRAFT_186225 [Zopfia rhizophila CBS 207.26]
MTRYQADGNTSYGNSIQINGPVHGNVGLATDLQPSFFKTSNYESYKNINPERVPETCVWFLEHPTFQKWKASSGDDLLWLSADPGCGKSVLSQALIDEKLVGAESVTLCYFFFKDNDEQNNTAKALCALLHQLFWAHEGLLQKHIASAVKKCGQALKNNFEELWQIFISAATNPSAGGVICILDALDECQESDRNVLIAHLERFYSRSVDKSKRGSKLKFLVTSRPYNEIERGFSRLIQSIPTIRLAREEESEKISHEIGIVIEAKVKDIAEKRGLREDVRSSLQRRLCEIPNRTYLWLHLTLDQVEKAIGKTQKKLFNIIDTLPRTVEEAYEKILARCVQEEARRVLHIIVASQRPLTLSEIDVALEIELDSTCYEDLDSEGAGDRKGYIRESCGLFIIVVDSRVYLIHQTAREFLVRKKNEMSAPQGWRHSVDLQEAHRVLSMKCIIYLLFRELQEYRVPTDADAPSSDMRSEVQAYSKEHAFLDYSAKHWISHVQEAHVDSPDWVYKTAKLCDIGDGSSCAWFRIYSSLYYLRHSPDRSKRPALYWAVMFGLINETKYLLKSDLDSVVQGGYFQNTLQAAAENRDRGKELVTLLLEHRGDRFKITEELVRAAALNDECGREIMALLLEQRAGRFEISAGLVAKIARFFDQRVMALLLEQRGDEVKITEEVVRAAAGNGIYGREVMALLLEQRGDEVKITEEVVRRAAGNDKYGREVMALLLEQRGDEIKITKEVVRAAAENWHSRKEVMALLLEQQADRFEISAGLVAEIARSFDQKAMTLLLEQRGDEVKITEEVVRAAAGNDKIWERSNGASP